ncbi:MAG: FecR family protein [Elusimicrobiota bacterium]
MRNILAAALILVAAPASLCAADAVLKRISGPVTVVSRADGAERPARAGQKIKFGDEIRTGEGGMVHVVMRGGAAVLAKPKTRLSLAGTRRDRTVDFAAGEFLVGLKRKLGRRDRFQVRTPAAVASVRGTLLWGLSGEDESAAFACFEGAVNVEAQGRSTLLTPGRKVAVPSGEAPGRPEPSGVPLSYLDTFAVDGSLQGLRALAEKESGSR